MRITLYKVVFDDDSVFYTNDRSEICDVLNKRNEGVDGYKPYTINKINSVLYNNTKKTIGFKTIQRYYVSDYYQVYIDAYVNNLLTKKQYTDKSLKRIKNQYLLFINDIEIALRNNGEGDAVVKQRINETIIRV